MAKDDIKAMVMKLEADRDKLANELDMLNQAINSLKQLSGDTSKEVRKSRRGRPRKADNEIIDIPKRKKRLSKEVRQKMSDAAKQRHASKRASAKQDVEKVKVRKGRGKAKSKESNVEKS